MARNKERSIADFSKVGDMSHLVGVNDTNNKNANGNVDHIANKNANNIASDNVIISGNEIDDIDLKEQAKYLFDDPSEDEEDITQPPKDVFDRMVEQSKKRKEDTNVLVGIYFEKEVARALDRLHKKHGKGIKSRLVNEAVKKVLIEKGWLE